MNKVLAPGIAHVSFLGGGTFLPARDLYEREILAEYVADRVHMYGRVQVLITNQRWTVCVGVNPPAAGCTACGCSLSAGCCSSDSEGRPYCVECAFGAHKMPIAHGAQGALHSGRLVTGSAGC